MLIIEAQNVLCTAVWDTIHYSSHYHLCDIAGNLLLLLIIVCLKSNKKYDKSSTPPILCSLRCVTYLKNKNESFTIELRTGLILFAPWPERFIREIRNLLLIFLCRHSQICDGRRTRKKSKFGQSLTHMDPHSYQDWGGAKALEVISGISEENQISLFVWHS